MTTRHASPAVHAALLGVALLFSINYILAKIALRHFDPLAFAYVRVIGSALLLLIVSRRSHLPHALPREKFDTLRIFGFAALGVVINQTLFVAGLALTSAHTAAILITMIPVFTLLAAVAAGRERLAASRIAGIAIAGSGALLIVGLEGAFGDGESLLGDVLILVNCLSYALYLVFSKPMTARIPPIRFMTQIFVAGSLLMTPVAAIAVVRQSWAAVPLSAWLALAGVIAGPTVGAYLLNAWALARAESSSVAAYSYVQPLVATILAALFLGETIRGAVVPAAALIFAGVWLAGRKPAARPMPGSGR